MAKPAILAEGAATIQESAAILLFRGAPRRLSASKVRRLTLSDARVRTHQEQVRDGRRQPGLFFRPDRCFRGLAWPGD